MKHFRDEEWLDYVRGLSPEPQRAAMERSLSEGCQDCRKIFAFWRLTLEVGARESACHVPDDAVDAAVDASAVWIRRYRLRSTARKSRRIFDSFLRPALAGVRGASGVGGRAGARGAAGFLGASAGARRLLAVSGQWTIDLRLEAAGDNRVLMVGQVLRSGEQTGAPGAGEAIVMRGDDTLARTAANQFGEFQLQYGAGQNLRLYVEIPDERPIVVELPDNIETNPDEGSPDTSEDKS